MRRVFAVIGGTVVAVVLVLVALEVGTRVLVGAPPPTERIVMGNAVYAYHPWSGHRATPGFTYKHLSINRRGWRGPDRLDAKPPGVRRAILLGDSVAFSSYEVEESATIAGYLETFLRERLGGSWEAINMAVPAGQSHTSLATLAHEGIHLAPDVVIVLNGANDVVPLSPSWPEGPLFSHLVWPKVQLGMADLYDPRTGRGRVGANLRLLLAESAFYRRVAAPPRVSFVWPDRLTRTDRIDEFVRSVEAMHFLARGAGATFVHFLQPYLSLRHGRIGPREEAIIRGDEASWGPGLYRFMDMAMPVLADRLQSAGRARGFRAVDLTRFFVEESIFSDHVHFIERDPSESVANRRLAGRMVDDVAATLR
jgi:hypothetical protein